MRRSATTAVLRGRPLLALLAVLLFHQVAAAQETLAYTKGLSVSPAYEGWMKNEDGSFTLYFGYMNPNWVEEFDVPIGPENNIEPGGPDQGQPTHFYSRRTPYLFSVRVPEDFGQKELVWTLTTHGRTERAYGSLKPDYVLNKQTISLEVGGDLGNPSDASEYNVPPDLTVEGPKLRTAKVGEPVTLVAIAGDPDNWPPRVDGKPQPGLRVKPREVYNPSNRGTIPREAYTNPYLPPGGTAFMPSGPGLRLSWIVYRGTAKYVSFDPDQFKTWTDTRPWANSPWSPPTYHIPEPPPDGRWLVKVTFSEPGTYVLRAIASDISSFINADVTIEVTPASTATK